jgi:hypothetical protein
MAPHARKNVRVAEGGRRTERRCRAAAIELAAHRFDIQPVPSDARVLKWMVGTNFLLTLLLLAKLLGLL